MTADGVRAAEAERTELDDLLTPSDVGADRRTASTAVQLVVVIGAVSALCVVAVFVITVAAPVVVEVVATLIARLATIRF